MVHSNYVRMPLARVNIIDNHTLLHSVGLEIYVTFVEPNVTEDSLVIMKLSSFFIRALPFTPKAYVRLVLCAL